MFRSPSHRRVRARPAAADTAGSSSASTRDAATVAGTPEAVQNLIEGSFDDLSPELQRAARWVRQHGNALALNSMRQSARQAGVTPATMTRLAQRLGFAGFDELRAPFVERLSDGAPASSLMWPALRRDRALAATLQLLGQAQTAQVAAVRRDNTLTELVSAADAMLGARPLVILGLRASLSAAAQLHYGYSMLAGNARLLLGVGDTLIDQVAQIEAGGLLLVVSQSPYARATVEAVQVARRHGVRVMALTDSRLAPVARQAEQVLLFERTSGAGWPSTLGAAALAEVLLTVVADRGGDTVGAHAGRRHKELRMERVYWEVPGRDLPAREPQGPGERHPDTLVQPS